MMNTLQRQPQESLELTDLLSQIWALCCNVKYVYTCHRIKELHLLYSRDAEIFLYYYYYFWLWYGIVFFFICVIIAARNFVVVARRTFTVIARHVVYVTYTVWL